MRRAIWTIVAGLTFPVVGATQGPPIPEDVGSVERYGLHVHDVEPGDWPQWGGTSIRNSAVVAENIPITWDIEGGTNILWKATLGSQSYGSPVVANGQIYVGTNNQSAYVPEYPRGVDLGCLICFNAETGKFLWQHSNEKLPTGRVHDWPHQGIVSTPCIDGDRLWYVSNRGEVCCLDTAGFRDEENDGPFKDEKLVGDIHADVVWKLDMMKQLGVSQHNMCTSSPTTDGKRLFLHTSNGVDESHINIPNPDAPAFLCLDRETGEVLWSDNSPGKNILHGQWSSPTYAVLAGRPQVLFGGGDGWLYSFDPKGDGEGNSKLLWKFDTNPKDAKWMLGGRGRRNEYITAPVIYDGKVYIATGQDAEHGEGPGDLWCIDPGKAFDESDVSPHFVVDLEGNKVPQRRLVAIDRSKGENLVPNPDSAVIWHYTWTDLNQNRKVDFEERMHRSCANPTIRDGLVYVVDFSGLVHCIDAETGIANWTYDCFAASWIASPLVTNDHVYILDEDGDVAVFEHPSETGTPLHEIHLENSTYASPIVVRDTLYMMNKDTLFAIREGATPKAQP